MAPKSFSLCLSLYNDYDRVFFSLLKMSSCVFSFIVFIVELDFQKKNPFIFFFFFKSRWNNRQNIDIVQWNDVFGTHTHTHTNGKAHSYLYSIIMIKTWQWHTQTEAKKKTTTNVLILHRQHNVIIAIFNCNITHASQREKKMKSKKTNNI